MSIDETIKHIRHYSDISPPDDWLAVPTADLTALADEVERLRAALLWALPYADDGVQMGFDLERHGVLPVKNHDIAADELFQQYAKLVGYESRYHPRTESKP